jgi:hypothetical protein
MIDVRDGLFGWMGGRAISRRNLRTQAAGPGRQLDSILEGMINPLVIAIP